MSGVAINPDVEAALAVEVEESVSWWGQCNGQHFHGSCGFFCQKAMRQQTQAISTLNMDPVSKDRSR